MQIRRAANALARVMISFVVRARRRVLIWVDDTLSAWRLRQSCASAEIIDQALLRSEGGGVQFSGWALSKSAIRRFCQTLLDENSGPLKILEFGGGASTHFWTHFCTLYPQRSLHVTTFEHDPVWAQTLRAQLGDVKHLCLRHRPLRVASDAQKEELFHDTQGARARWLESSCEASAQQIEDICLKNGFYTLNDGDDDRVADGIILDGPHGSGRSLVFALLADRIRAGALVLIDDYDHYPFLEDLGRVFHYTEIEKTKLFEKHWVLLRIEGVRA